MTHFMGKSFCNKQEPNTCAKNSVTWIQITPERMDNVIQSPHRSGQMCCDTNKINIKESE